MQLSGGLKPPAMDRMALVVSAVVAVSLVLTGALILAAALAGGDHQGDGGLSAGAPAQLRRAEPLAAAALPVVDAAAYRIDALRAASVQWARGTPRTARYQAPIAGPLVVVRPFQPPPTPYAAGHRGVDLRAGLGDVVLAAGAGRVRFAGAVAGRELVVLVHSDGVSTEYEPVTPLVHAGQTVALGEPIGRLHGTHGKCGDSCLHWGARRAGRYFDPLLLLHALGPVRLLPWR
jgi:murein DD-endopeptidase MepM/ murein hydrolase activator NlpD